MDIYTEIFLNEYKLLILMLVKYLQYYRIFYDIKNYKR